MDNDEWLKKIANRFKGVSGTGGLLGEIANKRNSPVTLLEPGDVIIQQHTNVVGDIQKSIVKRVMSPIAYDLWYLPHEQNILSRHTEQLDYIPAIDKTTMQDVPESNIETQFMFLKDKLHGIKPFTFIRDLDDLVEYNPNYWDWQSPNPGWIALSEYFIHTLAYEMWNPLALIKYESAAPDVKDGFVRGNAVGYLAFPVGQLGVMEVISILRESALEVEDFEITSEFYPIKSEETPDLFFSPANEYTGKNVCFGEHLFESGYVIPDDKKKCVEYLQVSHFPSEVYADIKPKYWLRYWVHKDDKFPVPGEFIGILVKPLALPPHVWWFQKTSPFLYAGNWVETTSLTSGIVTEKILESDRTDGGIGNEYKVKIHGYEIYIYASDYKEYEIGDRVAILKTQSVKETAVQESFVWTDMYMMEEMDKERKSYDYIILPFSFYK